jgi:hypothetical protein
VPIFSPSHFLIFPVPIFSPSHFPLSPYISIKFYPNKHHHIFFSIFATHQNEENAISFLSLCRICLKPVLYA